MPAWGLFLCTLSPEPRISCCVGFDSSDADDPGSPCPHGDGSAATGTCGTTRGGGRLAQVPLYSVVLGTGAYWTARASRADFLSARCS